ncbi:hypothetical protein BBJ28_00026708 [Nothophytophthora sp. Chile5]|nr:hypothetical protein BBJ28_00026708 [Nothophytophthora sp. Chile5]
MQVKADLKLSVQTADVVLMVLSARDLQGSAKGQKKLMLVVNKVDLCTLLNSLEKRLVAPVSVNALSTKRSLETQYNDKITLVDCPALDPD